MPVSPVSGVPEVRLHQARSSSGLSELALERRSVKTPYWAYVWAGGAALARHILDHPEAVAGRRVLDLGAGSGVAAIAAAIAGARTVAGADVDPFALAALALNAAANGLTIAGAPADLTAEPPTEVDLVLVGDLFYERALARKATAFLDRCAKAGMDVLVGDPGRAHLPWPRLERIASYAVADFGDGPDGATTGFVFRFRPAGT
jgi:predicted nicotinamide N-methyase